MNTEKHRNPVIRGLFADPSLIKYGETYYIYPTSDGFPGWSGTVFHAFSSQSLTESDWTDEGIILDLASDQVPWAVGSAWAPAMFVKNDKFYFYFCGKRPDGASCIGVAVSDSPVCGFAAMPEPLVTIEDCREAGLEIWQTIDPSVYEDEDTGEVFLLFGNGCSPVIAKLTDDLCGIVPGSMRNIEGAVDFREAVDVQKRGGLYHFTWSCDDTGSPNYHVKYGISDSLYGPIEYLYPVLEKKPEWDILGTGHHCIFREPGTDEYYIAFHRFSTPTDAYPGGKGHRRETCIEKLEFDENNRMKPVIFSESANHAGGYLLVHFTGEHRDGEQIYFALSRDGLHWTDLSETPVLRSSVGMQGVRDPFMVRDPHSGRMYLIATDLRIEARLGWGAAQFDGSRDIIVWQSDDLVTWSQERAVTVGIPEAGCVWAPESMYDYRKGEFFIYFASMVSENGEAPKQRMYGVYTKDFVTFSEPFQWIEREAHVIDTTMFASGGKYFRVFVDDKTHRLMMESSGNLTEGYTYVESETLASLEGVEGPVAYRLPDGKYCLLADHIWTGKGYVPMVTDEPGQHDFRVLGPDEYDMGRLRKRHGGVLRITDAEIDRLLRRFGVEEL